MTAEAAHSHSPDLRQLAEAYWEGVLDRNPVAATFFGDYRYNDRLPDIGPDGRAAEQAALEDLVQGLARFASPDLSSDDRVTWDMLRISARAGLDSVRLRLDELAVDQMDGPQVWLAELLNWHPLDTAEHVGQLVKRFDSFPLYMDAYLANLADGVRDGRTAPTIAVERVVGQLRSLVEQPPAESPFVAPAASLPSEQVEPLLEAVTKRVYPALEQMLDFLSGEYLRRHARAEPGIWAVTDGDEIYALLANQHTTTDLTPRQLHEIGLDELRGIHDEMRSIMRKLGASPDVSIREFTGQLIRDPANLPTTREEIVAAAEEYVAAAQAMLPRAFGKLPRTPCVVKPIEEYRERDMVAAFYNQPSADGSRPGVFYVNTFDPAARPRHTLPALVFHEAVPGHHLQIALAQEAEGLPTFRRLSAGWLANAFVEGWALYTERLADELGLYPDEQARLGMLGYQAWRACRLVVDTGMHHLRWSRQQAIDFFCDNVGLTERETVNEVDRYIVWPGQALSYKIGQREIESIRRDVESRHGDRFDLRGFHDELLRHAAVPLSTLRLIMDGYSRVE